MRLASPSILAFVLVLAAAPALEAQVSPHARMPDDGERFCAQVFLRAEGRTFGRELVEFHHVPAVAGEPQRAQDPEPEGPVRGDRVALWWRIESDSVGAYLAGEGGTLWEVRLGAGSTVLEGTLRRAVPPGEPGDVARAFVMRTPCRTGRTEGGGGRAPRP